MIKSLINLRPERILIDIDTQKDFFLADGTARIRNHRRILANIHRIVAWARIKHIPMISTVQIYYNGDGFKHICCIAGTEGQKKIRYTLRNRRTSFPAADCTDLPSEILKQYDQVILHKRCFDPFEEPRADRMLTELLADEFILIGASAEVAVKATALGLLARRKKVTVLVDATGSHNKAKANIAFRQMWAKGAELIETKELVGLSHLRQVRVCDCDLCHGRIHKSDINHWRQCTKLTLNSLQANR
ncbi:MAG: cysteine hydrolase family protein [Planctomycetota bacterium]